MFFIINPILIAAAVVPAIALLIWVYKLDKLEKEPPSLIVSIFFIGIISTGFAMITEEIGGSILKRYYTENTTIYNALYYFLVVAISEEGFKYLFMRMRTWNSPSFDCQFDGIVYATTMSLGFALWENILYVLNYGMSTALIRAVTAVPGHACFGVFMGIFYSLSKKYQVRHDKFKYRLFSVLSLLLPVLLHGTYDFIATMDTDSYAFIFLGFIAIIFTISFILVKKLSKKDMYIHHDDDVYYL